jgi:hypothetical protein
LIIKEKVDKEVQLRQLLDGMIHYLTAIRNQAYVPIDERMKGLQEVEKAMPLVKRMMIYLKSKEINK